MTEPPVGAAAPAPERGPTASTSRGLRRGELARVVRRRAWVVLGLSGLAVAQPILDLFGKFPEFFVAGNYTRGQIIAFALIVVIVPPLAGIAVVAAATAIDRRAGTVAFGVVVGLLAGAFVLALLRTWGVDETALVLAAAIAGGVGVALLVVRTRGAFLLASYLAAANLLFLGTFLFVAPTSELVTTSGGIGDLGRVDVPPIDGPVVVIVLDEFAAATIMRADGALNADRYPGFAELASVSDWFRNASSQFPLTSRSLPSILSGVVGDADDLPTYGDVPRNLFTLLGNDLPVHRYEVVTDMCPPTICEPPPRQPLTQALEDASVVYGHRVLPSSLRDGLPAIDRSWGDFGADTEKGEPDPFVDSEATSSSEAKTPVERAYAKWLRMDDNERNPLGQAGVLRSAIEDMTGEPALHFVHVALPHRPWLLTRSGLRTSYLNEQITDPAAPGYDFYVQMEYQLHSMQVGAVDTLMGELVDQLRSGPNWEDTTLVVLSDHGTNLTPPDIGRSKVTEANREEVYRMPLFVKIPGRTVGEIRDDSAQTIDVIPTLVDVLGIDTDWTFDGHSLYDGSEATTAPKASGDVADVLAIAARRAEQFHFGDDWPSLAAVGPNGDLVGDDVDDLDVGPESDYTVELGDADMFADLPTDDGFEPIVLHGRVVPEGPSEPPATDLVAAVNGRLAGVVGGWRGDADGWSFVGYVGEEAYRQGANTVDLYEVERTGGDVTLHHLAAA